MGVFDAKIFNPEAFGRYVSRIPNLARNELIKSRVFNIRDDLKNLLVEQTGGNYITTPILGLLDGEPLNYDGQTDITATSTKTYSQSMVVIGRAKAWKEKDFSYEMTGIDFMDNVAAQVAEYWTGIDQKTLLSILKGIFSMTGATNTPFVKKHTYDITEKTVNVVDATSLNNAIQQASGDNKNVYNVAIMHSQVATNLENLSLLEFLKYTDSSGIQRNLNLATWNGRLVIIDDDMPTKEITDVANGDYTQYTTYLLGVNAFDYVDCGAKVPYAMVRDEKTDGGIDLLYTRQRKLFAPRGISFTKKTMAGLSPTNAELERADNWTLVMSTSTPDEPSEPINHRAIPIARIISRG